MIFDDKLPLKRGIERRWSMQQSVTRHPTREASAWIYAPHFVGNPYQQLLTLAMPDHDITAMGAANIGEGVQLIRGASHLDQRVLHLHWLNVVLSGATTLDEAKARIGSFERTLDALHKQGVRLVWTMHNVLPHESVFEELEVRVREIIVQRAEMVHIMNPDTVAMAEPYFYIPADKVVRVEHPGYQGYYPERMSRSGARAQFGFGPEEQVSLVLGAIKPYKGLLDLAATFDRLSAAHPRKLNLLIAGGAGDDEGTQRLLEMASMHPAIHVLPERIIPEDVWTLFAAADNAIIPYKASLNSGALVLALSMGVPVIASSTAGSTHLLADGAGVVYSTSAELDAALLDRRWQDAARVRALVMRQRLHPAHVSDVFARVARAFIDQGVVAARAAAGPNGGLDD
jgi:glycosyltransferase involved in cell wall biosynthesis